MGLTRNQLTGRPVPGFESLPLRQLQANMKSPQGFESRCVAPLPLRQKNQKGTLVVLFWFLGEIRGEKPGGFESRVT